VVRLLPIVIPGVNRARRRARRARLGAQSGNPGWLKRGLAFGAVDDAVAQLDGFLRAYPDAIYVLANEVLAMVDARLRGAARLVYENWNATVVGYTPDGKSRHAVCSVAAYRRWVNLFFFLGPELADPDGLLRGTGSTVRNVRIENSAQLDQRVAALLQSALDQWPYPFDPRRLEHRAIATGWRRYLTPERIDQVYRVMYPRLRKMRSIATSHHIARPSIASEPAAAIVSCDQSLPR